MMMTTGPKPTIFISFSRQDERWKDRLVQHLRALGGECEFDVWDEQRIAAGDASQPQLERAIKRARVVVLLVSADFLESRFVREEEMMPLLRRRTHDMLPVVPVILRPCPWQDISWLSALQPRPEGGKPLLGRPRHAIEDWLGRIASEIGELLPRAAEAVPGVAAPAVVVPAPTPASPKPAAPPVERVPPPRRGAPWWQVALAGALVLAMAGTFYSAYRTLAGYAPALAGPPVLHALEFETVTVDERGAVRQRRRLQAQSFSEDLGHGVTLEMVAIPGGAFTMGSPASEGGDNDERPQHRVTIAPFYMSQFEVTQAQWRAVAALPRVTRDLEADPAGFKDADRPVERVSWSDAVEFCERLRRKSGRIYGLPSEAEWEYAARAGTTTPFAFGPTITPALVNYDGSHPYGNAAQGEYRESTTKVGSVGYANAFGLFDMHGNVWEWTRDLWRDDYARAPEDGRAWETGGYATRRVLRGGAWLNSARICRSAVRIRYDPELGGYNVGLRVACSVARTR